MLPFSAPHVFGDESQALELALKSGDLSGPGEYSRKCEKLIAGRLKSPEVMLTPSCTAALELAGLVLGIGPGDEVIVPSFSFVTTASAFSLLGATPVFVDISLDDGNISVESVRRAITARTKAIVVIHYGGVSVDFTPLLKIAADAGIPIVEDAAHSIGALFLDRPLGSIGALATFSFHQTKNITCGEGGALVVNDPSLVEKAKFAREKGTNREAFALGKVEKYSWVSQGSSYVLGELPAAFLFGQLNHWDEITIKRRAIWQGYFDGLQGLNDAGLVFLPRVPEYATHNGHIFFIRVVDPSRRRDLIRFLARQAIDAPFHYQPLHTSTYGREVGRFNEIPENSVRLSESIVRLPIWLGIEVHQQRIIDSVHDFFA